MTEGGLPTAPPAVPERLLVGEFGVSVAAVRTGPDESPPPQPSSAAATMVAENFLPYEKDFMPASCDDGGREAVQRISPRNIWCQADQRSATLYSGQDVSRHVLALRSEPVLVVAGKNHYHHV